jgi:WD40 repeat protein
MADVFISYSRKDVDFVRRLHDGLIARGKDVWIDFEDIPLTAEWRAEVFEGVESSDNFLFVITPDSLDSEVCTEELDHAVEQHKRLVPVLRRRADGKAVPDELAARNWTYFRDEDDFGGSLDALVDALETDLDWVSAHTRLLGRAREWKREGREGSYLLRGRDLDEAERWLAAESLEREPQPTLLQREYVNAGRRAATRRQRVLLGASLLAVLVALGLALLALLQRNEARREARVALSRQLAAQSAAALDVDPARSLALAARAAATSSTDEAADALRRSLRASLGRGVVPVSKARVWGVGFDRSGSRLVTASQDGVARVWEGGREVRSLRSGGALFDARFGPEGLIVTAGDRGAQVWRPGSARPFRSFGANANAASLSPDGRLVASAGDEGLRLWAVAARSPLGRPVAGQFSAVAFDDRGKRLAAASGSTATVWALPERRRLAVLRHPRTVQVRDVVFAPDGTRLATAGDDGILRVWSLPSGRPLFDLAGHDEGLQAAAFSTDGHLIVTASDDATARVWDLRRRRQTGALIGHSGSVLAVSFRPDGRLVATGGADGTVRLWALPDQPVVELQPQGGERVRDIRFSPDGRLLLTGSEDRTARVWRGASSRPPLQHGRRGPGGEGDWVESAAFGPGGALVATAGDDGTAAVWDARTGKPLAPPIGARDGPPLRAIDVSPDGDAVAVAGEDGAVRLWEWRQGRVRTLGRQRERVEAVAFAPGGASVASAGWDGTVRLWSLDGRQLAQLRGDGKRLSSVAFSPDGRRLAAGGWSGSTWIWDTKARRLLSTLKGRALVSAVAFGRSGDFVATAGDDGAARVYADGRLVALLPTRAKSLEAVAFAPDGARLAVAGDDGLAAVLDCLECRPVDELRCLAARRLGAAGAIDTPSGRCHPR